MNDASREDNGGDWCKECERYFLYGHNHDEPQPPTEDHPDFQEQWR